MEQFNWDYSSYSDILHIRKKDLLTKGSVELGDFTLDFGSNDEIVGIEIEHASEFFNNIDIDKPALSKIENAQFVIDNRNPQCQLIFLKLEVSGVVKKIPVPMPVVS